MRWSAAIVRGAALSSLLVAGASARAQEPAEQRDARLAWWREARFGMFIHWGLYAIPAGEWKGRVFGGASEWLMHSARITPAEYEPLATRFNPVKFDADAWAAIAADAGVKYVVITTKHHDGFCLFDTAHDTFDVMDATPFGRDVMKELSDAVRARGLRIGWYHSILDWHHPDYLPRRTWDPRPAGDADFPRYVGHLRDQVTELLTKYGPVGVMWFDGEWEDTWTEASGKDLEALCRKLQPGVIVNNRVGKGREGMAGLSRDEHAAGDFGTPEQTVPGTGLPGVDWESCMTMNDSWGYHRGDENWKSSTELVRTLIDCASKGGNFLLNVGPSAEGEIPPASVERLRAMGAWLRVNGEAIYGTGAGPFRRLPWGRATARRIAGGTRVYLHVFDWPADGVLRVPGLRNEVRGISLLASGLIDATAARDTVGVVIAGLPPAPPDPIATVVAMDVAGEPIVEVAPIRPGGGGVLVLDAADADVHGASARYEPRDDRRCIGFWTDARDTVSWDAAVDAPGRHDVWVTLACEPGEAGSTFRVAAGTSWVDGVVMGTGGWGEFRETWLGAIDLPGPGRVAITVTPTSMARGAVMNLRSLRLVPQRRGDR